MPSSTPKMITLRVIMIIVLLITVLPARILIALTLEMLILLLNARLLMLVLTSVSTPSVPLVEMLSTNVPYMLLEPFKTAILTVSWALLKNTAVSSPLKTQD